MKLVLIVNESLSGGAVRLLTLFLHVSVICFFSPPPPKSDCSYLKGDGLSTTDSGSSRKCFWLTLPVRVSMVTTGKPI